MNGSSNVFLNIPMHCLTLGLKRESYTKTHLQENFKRAPKDEVVTLSHKKKTFLYP